MEGLSGTRRRLLVAAVALAVIAAVAAIGLAWSPGSSEPWSDKLAFAAPPPTTTTTTTTTVPPVRHDVAVSTELASPNGVIAAYDAPDGSVIGEAGRWYGYEMTMPILEERGAWLRIMMPERPNGLTAWVRAEQVTRSTTDWHLIVDLSETTLYAYRAGVEQFTAPLGIGRDHTRTPTGSYFAAVFETPPSAGYGPVVLALNAHSEDIESWQGSGDAITAFHGPFGSQELLRAGGGKVSNGCLRMLNEDQLKLADVSLGSPVDIID